VPYGPIYDAHMRERSAVEPLAFDVDAFLASSGVARRLVTFSPGAVIYAQGDRATSVWYVRRGRVKMSVLSEAGKEVIVALVGPGDFFGEGCLAGQPRRMGTATALEETATLRIGKDTMRRTLHTEPALAERFLAHMLARNLRFEEDLVDQLFNSGEKRLARTLLLMAQFGAEEVGSRTLPNISQETLAEMVGTTRSRVNIFMNKFRKLGLVEYSGDRKGLKINSSLLTIVLHS
jgi:CRP/FNR family transcriptional regulator, cyclic AMP receptor protein